MGSLSSLSGYSASVFLRANKHETLDKTTLTSGAGVAGTIIQLTASTPIRANWIMLVLDDPNSSDEHEIDILTGASGSEVELIHGIEYHVNLTGQNIISIPFQYKVEITKGTRISARTTSALDTDTIDVHAIITGT